MPDEEEETIVDNLGDEDQDISATYSITSYGTDYPVDALVTRMRSGDIVVPPFQRGYVWTYRQACRFIESLLLGLPVPGIFLSKEEETQKLLIIDGHQRLRTLQDFYDGVFTKTDEGFKLSGLRSRFDGLRYNSLPEEDRRRLDDSILHATIVRQDEPEDEGSSIYLIFERLNTGGTDLAGQEIRAAVYRGEFSTLLKELNAVTAWREIFGRVSNRMRDQELILRFLGLHVYWRQYESPMKEFLNRVTARNKHLQVHSAEEVKSAFIPTVKLIREALGIAAFRPQGVLNAAVFDSVMVGVSTRLAEGPISDQGQLAEAYKRLLESKEYMEATERATAREEPLKKRIGLAIDAFRGVK